MNPRSRVYSTVAPWPGQDDGDEGRQRRGLAIAAITKIQRTRVGYKVPSQSGNGTYIVSLDDSPYCTCPDFESRQRPCKHVYAVLYTVERETEKAGYISVIKSTKIPRWLIHIRWAVRAMSSKAPINNLLVRDLYHLIQSIQELMR